MKYLEASVVTNLAFSPHLFLPQAPFEFATPITPHNGHNEVGTLHVS